MEKLTNEEKQILDAMGSVGTTKVDIVDFALMRHATGINPTTYMPRLVKKGFVKVEVSPNCTDAAYYTKIKDYNKD